MGQNADDRRRLVASAVAAMLTATMTLLLWSEFRVAVRGNALLYFFDFRAFYCSATVAASHQDPYRAEPLGECERSAIPESALRRSGFVIPSPLPGWVILLLEPLARLPFVTAATIFWGILVAAFIGMQLLTARLLPSLNPVFSFFCLLPLGLWIPEQFGQPVSISLVLLLASAIALEKEFDSIAGLLAGAATIEPHVALPVCLALFVTRPGTRLVLTLTSAALLTLSFLAIGPQATMEYVGQVVPTHIFAESGYSGQFSATYIAVTVGLSRTIAVVLGQASYWIAAGIAILLVRRYAFNGDAAKVQILVPMAFSVMGGPYVHVEHILAAVPFALYLLTLRRNAAVLMVAIAISWPLRSISEFVAAQGGSSGVLVVPSVPIDGRHILAEVPWATAIHGLSGSLSDFFVKLPTWAALTALAFVAIRIAAKRSPAPKERCSTAAIDAR